MNPPRFPTRPVRPMRWTYSSMSLGKSKLMTCFTLQISRPRAATCNIRSAISINVTQHTRHRLLQEHSEYTHGCGDHNRATARAELMKRLLPIPLRAVTMDAGTRIALAIQEVLQGICTLLSLHKHQREGIFSCIQKNNLRPTCHTSTCHLRQTSKNKSTMTTKTWRRQFCII